jgi:hypothetical protein
VNNSKVLAMRTIPSLTPLIAASLLLAGCEGGSGSTGGGAPTPAPTVTPSPTPTPTPPPVGPAPNIGGPIGVALDVDAACTTAIPTYVSGTGTVANVGIGAISIGDYGAMAASGTPVSQISLVPNAGAGMNFSRYNTTAEARFTTFGNLSDFELYLVSFSELATFDATLGYTNFPLCFFAAGPPLSERPSGMTTLRGAADGLIQTAGSSRRLFPSRADATLNNDTGAGTVQIALNATSNTFTDILATPVPIGTVSANFTLSGSQIPATPLTGLPGYTGTVSGQPTGSDGMILVFRLSDAAGNLIWGAAALGVPTP